MRPSRRGPSLRTQPREPPRLTAAFGVTVRRLREEAGFSQLAFALTTGVSRTYAGELERGEKSPTLDVVERIASTLGLTYEKLFSHVDAELCTRGPRRSKPLSPNHSRLTDPS